MIFKECDFLTFKYLFEQGFLDRTILYKNIGTYYYSYKRSFFKRIKTLIEKGYLREEINILPLRDKTLIIPTEKARERLMLYFPSEFKRLKEKHPYLNVVSPKDYIDLPDKPSKTTSEHDYLLTRLRFKLEKQGLYNWKSNRLKSINHRVEHSTWTSYKWFTPDAVFENYYTGEEIVLELELTLKSKKRYKELFNSIHLANQVYDKYKKHFYVFYDDTVKNYFINNLASFLTSKYFIADYRDLMNGNLKYRKFKNIRGTLLPENEIYDLSNTWFKDLE